MNRSYSLETSRGTRCSIIDASQQNSNFVQFYQCLLLDHHVNVIISSCLVCPGGEPTGVGFKTRHFDNHIDKVPLKRLRSPAAMPVGASCMVAPSSSSEAATPPLVPSNTSTVAELDKWKEDLNATRGLAEVSRLPYVLFVWNLNMFLNPSDISEKASSQRHESAYPMSHRSFCFDRLLHSDGTSPS